MRYEDRVFADEDVVLDGNEFVRCHFNNCNLIYRATGEPATLDGCMFGFISVTFDGAAASTVQTMTAMYAAGGQAREIIERAILNIVNNIAPERTNT